MPYFDEDKAVPWIIVPIELIAYTTFA